MNEQDVAIVVVDVVEDVDVTAAVDVAEDVGVTAAVDVGEVIDALLVELVEDNDVTLAK